MSDKPTVHLTLAQLDKEAAAPEPFRVGLSGGKTLTFPDPGTMDVESFEKFLADVSGKPNSEVLKRWLSPEDYEKLVAEKLPVRQIIRLAQAAEKHYFDVLGSPGEEPGSTAS